MTLGLVVAFWFGGLIGLLGSIVGTWNMPEKSAAERDAFAVWSKDHPAQVFGIIVALTLLWPALIVYLLAQKDAPPGPPADG